MEALNLNEMAALEGGFSKCQAAIVTGAVLGGYAGFSGGATLAGIGAIPGAIIGGFFGSLAG